MFISISYLCVFFGTIFHTKIPSETWTHTRTSIVISDFFSWQSSCKEFWIARRKHQHLQTAGKYDQLGKLDVVPQKERQIYRKTERERQREGGCSVYEKGV